MGDLDGSPGDLDMYKFIAPGPSLLTAESFLTASSWRRSISIRRWC
jgi:hypothetical protein